MARMQNITLNLSGSLKMKKFAVRFIMVALMILMFIVTPLALFLTWSPFHDLMDYERFGLCDGLTTAEDCEEYATQTVVFWQMYFPSVAQVLFLPAMVVYLLIELLLWLFRHFRHWKNKPLQ